MRMIEKLPDWLISQPQFEEPDALEHDGVCTVTKAQYGFWAKECSECGLRLVNGIPADPKEVHDTIHNPGVDTRDRMQSFSALPESQFVTKRLRDGTKVWDCLVECPDCGAVLKREKEQ